MAKREIKKTVEEPLEINENVSVEPEVKETKKSKVTGLVSGCTQLNIRKSPSLTSDKLCVVNAGAKLTISPEGSSDEWCKVVTDKGVKGYCMKQYVTIND